MLLNIDFDMVAHDTRNSRLNFGARFLGERVPCAITEEALHCLSRCNRPLDTDDLIWTLRDNSTLIASAATELWEERRFEPDGYILLYPADVMKLAHAMA